MLWFLFCLIVIIGLVGGYYQVMLFSQLKDHTFNNLFFGEWVFNSDNLTEEGKRYRKAIFICWAIVVILIFLIRAQFV